MLSRDPGLQPERTGLAWSRTGMLALIVACLSIRIGLTAAAALHLLVALLLAALGCMSLHRGHQRSRYVTGEEVATSTSRKYLLATSGLVVIACFTDAALLLTRLMR
ncbi:DUF202 domain-containing protein [Afipia felis]|uniref:DUF202 domain-containing protein n=2 Tax=Afipia felis TaxID=1035 RepID=A0A380WAW3_AFIFE|nr:DUF202 domain-containing protein [Afipia felis]EKS29164.1 hypothetical protein HMPREF9697_01692 [Afipia felis ATCC 53690]SUU77871.1 Uncharacterised protein [Afipia felis]SUU85936.1 Uncharacterised protein [Afipia felis]